MFITFGLLKVEQALFTILLGPWRDPPHCFVSMTVKDNDGLEPWSALSTRVRICISPLGVLSSDVKRGYVIYV